MKSLLFSTKRIYTLIVGVLLVLAFIAGGIFMHSASAASSTDSASAQKLAASDCKPKVSSRDTVLGTITSIKGSAFTLNVFKGNSKTVNVKTTASTELVSKIAGRKISVKDLHVGNFVQVSGTLNHDGSLAAKSIVVGPAPSASDQNKTGDQSKKEKAEKEKSATNNQRGAGGFGRVTSIKGTTFTIQSNGQTLVIKTTNQTEFYRKTTDTKVTLSNLKVGDSVIVKGTLNSDGSINALGVLAGAQPDQQTSACKPKK